MRTRKTAVAKTLQQQIQLQKLKIFELQQQLQTALYFETMPEYDPLYKYSYSVSNMTIPHAQQDMDAWLRAIILHMKLRRPGHGGAYTDAIILSCPDVTSENMKTAWVGYYADKMSKKIKVLKPKP